ncbi:hypothetical protein [Sphingomonas jaspsi]|nr:hypothetical protein [Sphingomonas jaspsi]
MIAFVILVILAIVVLSLVLKILWLGLIVAVAVGLVMLAQDKLGGKRIK